MTTERVRVTTPDGEMPAALVLPESGSGPGIVLVQEIFGVSGHLLSRAADLAAAGYVVLAPELYWRLGVTDSPERPDALEDAFALKERLDWDHAVQDTVAAHDWLRASSHVTGGVGILGFCLGGGIAFNAAALSRPDVLVTYYGSALPELLDLAPEVTAPSLHHFGTADSYIDAVSVGRIRTALETRDDVTFKLYFDADHAFDNPHLPLHHPESAERAWRTTLAFLAEHLPPR
jgi:carboxymethylenebutenolidase